MTNETSISTTAMNQELTEEEKKADEFGAYIYNISRTAKLRRAIEVNQLSSTASQLLPVPFHLATAKEDINIAREGLHWKKRKASLPVDKQNRELYVAKNKN